MGIALRLLNEYRDESPEAEMAFVNKIRKKNRVKPFTKAEFDLVNDIDGLDNDHFHEGELMTLKDLIAKFGDLYRDEMDDDNPNFNSEDFIDMIEADHDVYIVKRGIWFIC